MNLNVTHSLKTNIKTLFNAIWERESEIKRKLYSYPTILYELRLFKIIFVLHVGQKIAILDSPLPFLLSLRNVRKLVVLSMERQKR